MASEYIIRFDDLCPTMNHKVWRHVQDILDDTNISPLLAVVPENHDPQLEVDAPDEEFWQGMVEMAKKGATIAIHGLHHTYDTQNGGILKINPRSEFAGHPFRVQRERLERAKAIMLEHGLPADTFVAPGHSYDTSTLDALSELSIMNISDGFYRWPVQDHRGLLHVPQQLWGLSRRPSGVWTVCYHFNGWLSKDIENFRSSIEKFRHRITEFQTAKVKAVPRRLSAISRLEGAVVRFHHDSRLWLGSVKTRIKDRKWRVNE